MADLSDDDIRAAVRGIGMNFTAPDIKVARAAIAADRALNAAPSAEHKTIAAAPVAIMDTRDALGLCAPTEADFPALYALRGRRVALVDLGPA